MQPVALDALPHKWTATRICRLEGKGMKSALRLISIAIIVGALLTVDLCPAVAEIEIPEGCPTKGVSHPADYYLPALYGGWVIQSDERRTAEQLAARFPDPADGLSRFHAWCWLEQAELVYRQDNLTVDVSIHNFAMPEGAVLAERWFAFQQSQELGLRPDVKSREKLEAELHPNHIESLDNVRIDALYNDNEYTLYARNNEYSARVTISGEPSAQERSREFYAYFVLSLAFNLRPFDLPPENWSRDYESPPGQAAPRRTRCARAGSARSRSSAS
jgi:hypothetical protein